MLKLMLLIILLKKYDKSLLQKCELYVVRIGPSNNSNSILKYSKPCINCQKNY